MLAEHCSLVAVRFIEAKRAIASTISDRPFQSQLPFSSSLFATTVSAITRSAASLASLGELGTSTMAGSIRLSGCRDTLILPFVRFQNDLIRCCGRVVTTKSLRQFRGWLKKNAELTI